MFSKKGFHCATVDEIIAIADTGKGTVYNYFSNKEQLFYTLIKERSNPFYQSLQNVVDKPGNSLDKISAMVRIHLQFMAENVDLWRVMIHEMRGVSRPDSERQLKYDQFPRQAIERVEAVVQQGIANGEIQYMNAQRAAQSLFSIIMMTVYRGLAAQDVNSTAESITDLFLHGIAGRR